MNATTPQINLIGYQAALEGIAFRVREGAGYVQVGGESRQNYLQRQTSNDLNLLSPALTLPNVLTSSSGRILEIFTLVELGENYGLLTLQKRGAALANYFKERIFFNDLVEIDDQSDSWIQIDILGPKAAELIAEIFGNGQQAILNNVTEGQFGEWQPKVIAQRGAGAPLNYLILAQKDSRSAIEKALIESQAVGLSNDQYELLRVEAGLPGAPEFTSDYTPYEIGLNDWVSETKGCYTGQEVLARQVTYDKITRRLVQLSADGPFGDAKDVLVEGKIIGQITSSLLSPSFGPLALAVLKRPHSDLGSEVQFRGDEGLISAQVQAPALSPELV